MTGKDETRERILLAIAERVPPERVLEVHLFQSLHQGGTESRVAVVAVDEESADRPAVYTARCRLTRKGPDRGKWEFAFQVEADAPLVTVDKVVRGVQRRSGDAEDPERVSGDDLRAMLQIQDLSGDSLS